MGKELPLIDFIEQLPAKKEQPILTSKEKKKPQTRKLELIASGYTEEQIENLRVKVRKAMDWEPGMNWAFAQGQAFRRVLNLPLFGKLSERHRNLLSLIASKSGSRGVEKIKAAREYKERHEVPEGKVFSLARRKELIADAERLRKIEEKRVGKTYVQSGIEAGDED